MKLTEIVAALSKKLTTFEKTISNTFGSKGKRWLTKLPILIDKLQKKWNLSDILPISNMSYHYVAKATHSSGKPVVIKVGCDSQLIQNEFSLLRANHSGKMIPLLDYDDELCALLMMQAQPGTTLKDIYPEELNFVMETYANLAICLHKYKEVEKDRFPHVSEWLEAIDRTGPKLMDEKLFSIAKAKKQELLSSMGDPKLLHGDLHLDNILKDGESWVCIDPKGVWGELEFEVAAFDIFAPSEFETATRKEFLSRIHCLADLTNVSADRLKDWVFIRLILSAVWFIEDFGDPSTPLELASFLI